MKILNKFLSLVLFLFLISNVLQAQMDTLYIVKAVFFDSQGTGRSNTIEIEFNQAVDDNSLIDASEYEDWKVSNDPNFIANLYEILSFETAVDHIAIANKANDRFIRINFSNETGLGMANDTYTPVYLRYKDELPDHDVFAYYNNSILFAEISDTIKSEDYAGPAVTSITFLPDNGTLKINSILNVSFTVSDSITYAEASILVNNNDVSSSITATDPFTFEVEYTVNSGDDDINVLDSIPIHISLLDTALNHGSIYKNSTPANTPGIDAHRPSISGVSFSPGSGTIVGIDSIINVTITATDLESDLSPNSITINGTLIPNGNVTAVGDGSYTFSYTVQSGHGSVLDSEKIDIAFIFDDAAGNTSLPYTTSSAAACPAIDDTAPAALTVTLSPNTGIMGIGDTIIYTITAGENGLTPSTVTINGKDLKNKFSAIGSSQYEIEYVIKSGDTNIPDASSIPINLMLKDAAGNPVTFNTLAAGDCPEIDASRPAISNVTFSPIAGIIAIDETITITITASESNLTADSIFVNGKIFAIAGTGPYTISYMIAEGDDDISDSSPIPIYFTLTDGANISLPFKTTNITAGDCPGIDANRPEIVSASFSPGSGKTLGIDSVLTVTFEAKNLETGLSASTMEVNGQNVIGSFAALVGSPGYYTVEYTVGTGDGSINDATQSIPISLVLSDSKNLTLPAFTNSTAAACPGIDDTAPAALTVTLSPNTGIMGIGDTIIYTITAGENGLIPSTVLINGKDLKNKFSAIGSSQYEIEYVIKSGDTNISDGSSIPINLILKDAAGNPVTFNLLIASECPGIDVLKPVINLVTVDPVSMIFGQTYTVTINVDDDGGDLYYLESGTIAGFNFHTLTRNSNTNYSLKFTVGNLGYDIQPEDSYDISNLVFSDPAGNLSNSYTATITQASDPIYTILPTAKVTGAYYVCDGDDADLSFQLTGNAPWSVELYDGTSTTTVGGINASPFTYSVEQNLSISTNPDTIVYKITQVSDVNGNIKLMPETDSSIVYVRVVPVVSFINPAGDKTYNINAAQDSLIGSPSAALGGLFSGDGVIPSNNKFFPSAAGLGAHEIEYTYTDPVTGCSSSDKVTLTVIASNASITIDDGDYWRCDYETTFDITAGVVDKAWIIGELKLHNVPIATGAISDHGDNTATIDVQKLSAGTYTLYYVYDDAGVDSVSNSFTVESVGKPNFTELSDICEDYETINVAAYNLIPTGGTGQFTFSGPLGAFVSNALDDNNSGHFSPGLIPPGSYSLEYIYTSPNGCESEMVPKTFDVNALPSVSFTMNSVYNVDQGSSIITGNPTDANGVFTPLSFMSNLGNGTADFDPADAGLGDHWVKYTYQDANSCVNADSIEITVNKALGEIVSSTGSFQFCYYGSPVATFTGTPNPTDGSPGSFYIDNNLITAASANTILFNPQDYTAGDHEVKFEYSNGTTDYEVYKTVNVDIIGNIYFTGLADNYCENEDIEIELTAFYPGQDGVMKFTGLGVTDNTVDELAYFNPSKANLGDNLVRYTFTRDFSGCQKTYTESVTINRTPTVAFSPNERCIVNSNDLLGFKAVDHPEDSIAKWTWLLKNQIQSNDTFPLFSILPGSYNSMRLTLETNKGCTHFVDSSFYIGTRVDIQFSFDNECNGEVSEFKVNVSSNINDIQYVNWDFGGPGISDVSDSLNPTHQYTDPGGYEVIYEEFTKSCGRIADTMKINIRPSVDLSIGNYIADFENNPDITGWVIEDYVSGVNNPWQWGEPSGTKIYTAASGTNIFGTNLGGNYANNDKGMVTSPCFDFSSLQRPMLKMDFIADMETDRDGVVMQYTKANGDWATIGVPSDGINWYNSYIIGGAPADQQLGWTGEFLSSDNSGWLTAMYRLDELRGRAGVRFRLVFGSDLAGDNYEGFAFDNIQFGERTRMVLLENFTNSSNDKANNTQENTIDPILLKDSLDVISINYHTSFPSANNFNSFYPSGPSARALYYGVSQVPYSLVDGGERKYDYTLTNTLTESDIHKRVLIDPQFEISVEQDVQGNNLVVSYTVLALEETYEPLIVYIAVVEKTVVEGTDIYHNVLRTMLPDAAGILVEKDWIVGDEVKLYQTWSIPENVNEDSLITIVFVQDEESMDIYQTGYTEEFTTITAIDDIKDIISSYDYRIYPNPVKGILSVQMLKTVPYPIEISMYNGVGVLIKTAKLMSGESLIELETNEIPSGVYYLKLSNPDNFIGTNKFVKTE